MNESIIWTTNAYEQTNKAADWYWAVSIITISLAAAAFILQNVLFGVLIVISGILLMVYSVKKPETLECELNQTGLRVNEKLYPYPTLKSFWISHESAPEKLILQSKKAVMPYIIIPLNNVDPVEVREVLLDVLPEEEHHEPLSEKVMNYLGF